MLDASTEAENALCAGEVDVSRLRVRANEFHAKPVSHVESLLALGEHALNEGLGNANEGSMIGHASDNGVEGFADVVLHGDSGQTLRHLAFDLLCSVLLLSAVGGDGGQFSVRVRIVLAGEQRLDNALSDDIGEATVGRGGV